MTDSQPSERRRLLTSGFVALVAGVGAAFAAPWQFAVLFGWDTGAALLIGWIWASVGKLDAEATKKLAVREDNTRAGSRAVVVIACIASLAGVFVGIVKARQIKGLGEAILTGVSLLSVVLAWVALHTVFMLRYAHKYYERGDGIDFPKNDTPTYRDFAYVAFTVGMTFQVSDTDITNPSMRALLLRHAALSYLFGTFIVGLTINVLGALLG